ncbi:MAG: arginine N-succinyltransferase [Myxococcales bacterium]|nr:arginine N-succinyltransferase [Myxococcales bacterium]
MFVVRESRPEDVEEILAVAKHLDSYNLPYNREVIIEILQRSSASFAGTIPIVEREFTFVVEDTDAKRIVGTSMLYAQHGTHHSPHVYLDVLQDEHYSETLDTYLVHQALRIGYNYNGPTEIGGLIVLPEFRGHAQSLGKLLSCSRFLFIAMHRDVFRDTILSELLPRLEGDGTSRLWKHYGKRFTGLTYREADQLSKDNKEFIKSLFPQGMVYTSLFPKDVQAEIGEVGPQTKGVERLLRRIGFYYANQIDPFDGGPHFEASTDTITLVANASEVSLASSDTSLPEPEEREFHLVAMPRNGEDGFRCTWSPHPPSDSRLALSVDVAKALQAEAGDAAWTVRL